jgi:hypothetical protein
VLVGAVGHLVGDRLDVRPQPGDRPQQAAEHQRQQAQHLDGVALRVMALVGDFLRQHVHHPEQHDQADRYEDQHEPCESKRRGVHHLRRQEGGLRGGRKRQRTQDERGCGNAGAGRIHPSGRVSAVSGRQRRSLAAHHGLPVTTARRRGLAGAGPLQLVAFHVFALRTGRFVRRGARSVSMTDSGHYKQSAPPIPTTAGSAAGKNRHGLSLRAANAPAAKCIKRSFAPLLAGAKGSRNGGFGLPADAAAPMRSDDPDLPRLASLAIVFSRHFWTFRDTAR